MKLAEYIRLGKISIKSRKKSTRNTVRGISFGLTLLIPVLFFALAFYVGLYGELDNTRTVACFNVETKHVTDSTPSVSQTIDSYGNYSGYAMPAYATAAEFKNLENLEQSLVSEFYQINRLERSETSWDSDDGVFVSLDGEPFLQVQAIWPDDRDKSIHSNGKIRVAHRALSGGAYYTEAERQDCGGSIFLEGEGFSEDARGEIILSQALLRDWDLPESGVVGKQFTLQIRNARGMVNHNGQTYLDDDGDPDNGGDLQIFLPFTANIFQNFTVVGVVSDDLYRLGSREGDGHIWVSAESLYDDDGESAYRTCGVTVTAAEEEASGGVYRYRLVTFEATGGDLEAAYELAAQRRMMFPLIGELEYSNINGAYFHAPDLIRTKPTLVTELQLANYRAAVKADKRIQALLAKVYPGYDSQFNSMNRLYAGELYQQLRMVNTIGGYVVAVLFTFGGIVFFATLLNLYNSINYSVEARRNYMGVMRAIGARSGVIPRLYLVEILLIFRRAFLWVLFFSLGMSLGIKFGIDAMFRYIGGLAGVTFSLNLWYYAATLAIVFAFVFLIAYLFSAVACKNVAGKSILRVLRDDR